eukprot:m.78897 g.78897  ORF g.78897 m.78897 type:complete len:591 (+) comp12695_c0_seq3:278-2050(+)
MSHPEGLASPRKSSKRRMPSTENASGASVDAAMCLINMNASEPSPKRTKVSSTKLHNSSMPSPLGRGAQRFPGNTNSNPKRSKANESKGPVGLVKPDSENKSHPKVRDPVASKPVGPFSASKLTAAMQEKAQHMRHFVKNPAALQWCICEHFYSTIDRAALQGSSPFLEQIREKFPKIALMENLTKFQWFYMRKALKRPRRFSAAFVKKEINILNQQRDVIRLLQQGVQPETDGILLPSLIPLPLSVGRRVLARPPVLSNCPEGIVFPGFVLAICSSINAYRIEFDLPSLGVQTVPDTDLTPIINPGNIAVDVLLKERVHVPSAGIAERPRVHRRPASIHHLEQKRSPFSGGENVMSSELETNANLETPSKLSRDLIEEILNEASGLADSVGTVDLENNEGQLTAKEAKLLAATEQLLGIKEAILATQDKLNSNARRSLVEDVGFSPGLLQHYRFVIKYADKVDTVLELCMDAISKCKSSKFKGSPSSDATGDSEADSTSYRSCIQEARRMTDSVLSLMPSASPREIQELIEAYASLLLVARTCAQQAMSADEMEIAMREVLKRVKPTSTSINEDLELQLAAFISTIGAL